jgi:hypothetical protein
MTDNDNEEQKDIRIITPILAYLGFNTNIHSKQSDIVGTISFGDVMFAIECIEKVSVSSEGSQHYCSIYLTSGIVLRVCTATSEISYQCKAQILEFQTIHEKEKRLRLMQ